MKKIEIKEEIEDIDDVFTSSTDLLDYGVGVSCSGIGSASCSDGCKSGNKDGLACHESCLEGCSEGCKQSCKLGNK